VENLLSLWMVLAQDMGERCAVDTTLDFEEVKRRTEYEGMPFLTVSLPKLGKATEKWLDQGYVDLADAPGWKSRRDQRTPIFLGGFYKLVFCPESGALWPEPNVDAILALRQLCGLLGKMFLPAPVEKEHLAMAQYISTDDEVRQWEEVNDLPFGEGLKRPTSTMTNAHGLEKDHVAFLRLSMLLCSRLFDRVNRDITSCSLVPKHGPGSTADGLMGNQKFAADWTWRLEKYFPSDSYLIPNPRYVSILDAVEFRDPETELPVKVISVPKTQSAPRVIAMEPVCMQYAQQAISRGIMEGLREDPVLKHFLRLECQEINQFLAREGSLQGSLATLDLSEASDRISNKLVRFMTGRWAHLDGAIQSCRTGRALVRTSEGEKNIPLAKFASMGSALTFPLESIIFLVVVFIGIENSIGRRLSRSDILGLAGKVAVYGDDIIVPTDHVGSVIHALEAFGFKVNSHKSFWTGKFRESCGKDYYDGVDVSYVKFRKQWPDDRRDVEEIISLVSFFNQCKDAHYTQTTSFLRGKLRVLLKGFFPRVSRDSAILGEHDDLETDVTGMHPTLHHPITKGWVIKAHVPRNPLDGERALLKYFLKEGEEPFEKEHLQRSGRSRAVSIKLCNAAT